MLKAAPEERQYIEFTTDEVLKRSESATSINELELLVYELQFRSPKSSDVKHRKAQVYLKLLKVLQSRNINQSPAGIIEGGDIVPIKRLISRENRNNYKQSQSFEWRDIGVLKASGYSVGVNHPTYRNERYKILDCLILMDDLKDITDRNYALEYGEPKTKKRLTKIVNSISFFIINASRVTTRDNGKAISDWKEDLRYLKSTYQNMWPDFYWQDI